VWSKIFPFQAEPYITDVFSSKAVISMAFLAATSISYGGNTAVEKICVFLLASVFTVYGLCSGRRAFSTPIEKVRV